MEKDQKPQYYTLTTSSYYRNLCSSQANIWVTDILLRKRVVTEWVGRRERHFSSPTIPKWFQRVWYVEYPPKVGNGEWCFHILRLNVKKQRLGFIKFQGVHHVVDLEKNLDTIWIGKWKLCINRPRYSWSVESRKVLNDKQKEKVTHKVWRRKESDQTFT